MQARFNFYCSYCVCVDEQSVMAVSRQYFKDFVLTVSVFIGLCFDSCLGLTLDCLKVMVSLLTLPHLESLVSRQYLHCLGLEV